MGLWLACAHNESQFHNGQLWKYYRLWILTKRLRTLERIHFQSMFSCDLGLLFAYSLAISLIKQKKAINYLFRCELGQKYLCLLDRIFWRIQLHRVNGRELDSRSRCLAFRKYDRPCLACICIGQWSSRMSRRMSLLVSIRMACSRSDRRCLIRNSRANYFLKKFIGKLFFLIFQGFSS